MFDATIAGLVAWHRGGAYTGRETANDNANAESTTLAMTSGHDVFAIEWKSLEMNLGAELRIVHWDDCGFLFYPLRVAKTKMSDNYDSGTRVSANVNETDQSTQRVTDTAMAVLVTGGAGYIGSVLVPKLLGKGYRVRVLDRFYFGDTLGPVAKQHPKRLELVRGDVRAHNERVFDGVHAVIDLAGISNDPSCELKPELTRAVNFDGAVATMKLARKSGVARYVFASSCSVYGRGEGLGLTEMSELNPVSLYAKCKANAEKALFSLRAEGFCTTVLRLATVFGMSRRMRFDLAVNVMTKNAYTRGTISVDGGGKQWRPFVHVEDAADTMIAMLTAPTEVIDGQVFNVGDDAQNVQIINLAYRVRDAVRGSDVVVVPTDPDLRNYNVRFDKLGSVLKTREFRSIDYGITQVLEQLRSGALDPEDRRWYTLAQYRFLLEVEREYRRLVLNDNLLT